jgi:hypothetical protein
MSIESAKTNQETLIGAGTMFLGFMIIAETYIENKPNDTPLPQDEINGALKNIQGLTPWNINFISKYMAPYLTRDSIATISQTLDNCKAKFPNFGQDSSHQITFSGVPYYNETGQLLGFVPYAIGCSIDHPTDEAISGPLTKTNDLVFQLTETSRGVYDTLATPINSEEVGQFYTNSIAFNLSYYQVDEEGTLYLIGAPKLATSNSLITDNDFTTNVTKQYNRSGVCGFVDPSVAAKRIEAFNDYESVSSNTYGRIEINICSESIKGISNNPTEVDLNKLPPDAEKESEVLFGSAFPMAPENGSIVFKTSNKDRNLITLFESASPAITSHLIGYRSDDTTISEQSGSHLIPGLAGGWLTIIAGGAILLRGWHKIRKPYYHPNLESTKTLKRETFKRKEKAEKQPVVINSTPTETRTLPHPFTLDLNGESVVIYKLDDDIIQNLQTISTEPEIIDRIRKSRKELIDLFSVISKYNGNFGDIQKILSERRRFTEIHIGGDSATVSYKLAVGQGKQEQILGYLLIDANLEENYVQVELWDEEPKSQAINKHRTEIAETNIVQFISEEEPQYTIDEISTFITENILILMRGKEIDTKTFELYRDEVKKYAEKVKNDSRVKKEVIRRLADLIAIDQITIIERNTKPENTHGKYANIIAARLYDYITEETQTSSDEFDAFTQAAKNFFVGEIHALSQTAAKSWATRTGFRIQIVQAENEAQRRNIVILFTKHDH